MCLAALDGVFIKCNGQYRRAVSFSTPNTSCRGMSVLLWIAQYQLSTESLITTILPALPLNPIGNASHPVTGRFVSLTSLKPANLSTLASRLDGCAPPISALMG